MLRSPLNLTSFAQRPIQSDAIPMEFYGQKGFFLPYDKGGRHLTSEQLEPYRLKGDTKMDEIFAILKKSGRPMQRTDDIIELMQNAKSDSPSDVALRSFRDHYSTLPDWVDLEQLERGQRVYLAYLPAISVALYYRSLVPGFSIPKIAAVLIATKYLAPPSTRESVRDRLVDTAAMVAVCMSDIQNLLPNKEGWKAALRVRCLHAKVRHSLLQRKDWNIDELGVPINQEDMAATLLAFSANALLGVEIVLHRHLSEQDQKDYFALWRYIGWLLGVDVGDEVPDALDPCGPGRDPKNPDVIAHCYDTFQSIILHIMKPDQSSVRVCHHLLKIGTVKDMDNATNNWYLFRALRCREMIGDPLADALELPFHPTKLGQCRLRCFSIVYSFILILWTQAARPESPFRNFLIDWHKRRLGKFFFDWQEPHLDRMKQRTKKACPFAMLSQSEGDFLEQ